MERSAVKATKKAEGVFADGLEKFVYDPKSVGKFVSIVEKIGNIIFYKIINKNHVHMR